LLTTVPTEGAKKMRKLFVTEFVSLDGVMEDPGGAESYEHGGWSFQFTTPDSMQYKLDELTNTGAILLGRVTYEGFAKAWPSVEDEVGFAEQMNGLPKYVVSTTLETAECNNTTIISGDVAAEVAKLKATDGGDIMVAGSQQLVRFLLEHDLVDEIRLMVSPVVLGSGKRVFDGVSGKKVLELAESTATASGNLLLTYRRTAA
jgi:dihydrofolate reductase